MLLFGMNCPISTQNIEYSFLNKPAHLLSELGLQVGRTKGHQINYHITQITVLPLESFRLYSLTASNTN